ncbi:autotransporter-associated N-terminal domain-containing protein [Fusobacterium sp. PH5-44]|uniref:autotransporter-associated N-terminal domain-containing protein n=1 Tax=unclassified Fusobacterium TaxID=2648384 RepID=UPI003D234FB9
MNKMKKENENALKSFLKRKVSYTAGLLVAFLISGTIGFAAVDVIQGESISASESYFSSLETEKSHIQELLKENEKQLADANQEYLVLLRKGDFYSKPIHGSTQVFFNFGYENAGRSKNRTTKEWRNTIDGIQYRMAGYTLDKGINPYHKGEMIAKENGYQFSNLEDGSIYDPEASIYDDKYLKAAYAEDEYGNLISLAIPAGTSVYYTDVNGNNYYTVIDPSTGISHVVNDKGVAVRTDDLGDVVLESSLADNNINGNVPTTGTAGLGNFPNAMGELGQGNGVYLNEVPYMASLDIGANILPLDPDIPNVSKNVNVNVDAPVLGSIPSTPAAPVAPEAINITVNKPVVNVTAPSAVGSVSVTSPGSVNVNINVSTPVVSAPNISVPNFEARVIAAPEIPAAPDIPVIVPPTITLPNPSGGNWTQFYYWNTGFASNSNYNGLIGEVIVTGGKFEIDITGSSTDDGYKISAENYAASMPSLENGYHTAAGSNGWSNGGTQTATTHTTTTIADGGMGIYRIVDTPYGGFGSGTEVIITSTRSGSMRQFIHHDPHSTYAASSIANVSGATLEEFSEASLMETNYLHSSHPIGSHYQFLSLQGKITVNGGYMMIVGTQGHSSKASNVYAFNSGEININGNNNTIFGYTNANDSAKRYYYVGNLSSGKIKVTGDSNAVIAMNKSASDHVHNFKNKGIIEINGNGNAGVYLVRNINDGTVDMQSTVTISGGEKNAGVFQVAETTNKMNKESLLNVSITGGTGNVGYYSAQDQNLLSTGKNNSSNYSHIFSISGGSKNAAVLSAADLEIGNGTITLSGGSGNVGLVAQGGKLISTGILNITGGSENVGVVSKDGKTAEVSNLKSSGTVSNAIGLFASGSSSVANVTTDIEMKGLVVVGATNTNKNNAMGAFAESNGTITITNGTFGTSTSPDIEVTGMALPSDPNIHRGIGLMASNGKITAENTYIKVINGAAGVASTGTTATIDVDGSIIEVNNGYGIYSDGAGSVSFVGGKLILDGDSMGFTYDKSNTSLINIGTGATVQVKSDDVIVVNLLNAYSPNGLKISTFSTDIKPANLTITPDSGIDKYIIAAADGGDLTIDQSIDRTSGSGSPDGDYFKHFLHQRFKIVVNAFDVKAVLDNTIANTWYDGNVVGLAISSSSSGKAVPSPLGSWLSDTSITLVTGSKIIADRTEGGAGAIGAYINYGTVENNGAIEVEKTETTKINSGAVGIFSVNGSKVDNKSTGIIDVAGANSIGILSQSYREKKADGSAIVGEFDTIDIKNPANNNIASDQGQMKIVNNGKITLDGDGSVGIYAENNGAKSATLNTVSNEVNGIITVGKDKAVGIYGTGHGTAGVRIQNNGIIEVGTDSYGIYAAKKSSINGAYTNSLGTYKLDDGSIGIVTDGTSTLDGVSTNTPVNINLISTTSGEGTVGIVFGDLTTTIGIIDQFKVNINVNTTTLNTSAAVTNNSFTKGTVFYVNEAVLFSNGEVNVADNGIGIYADLAVGINSNDYTADGIINLVGNNAIGLYTKKGAVANRNGSAINISKTNQYGMVVLDAFDFSTLNGGFAYNNGDININVTKGYGIYVGNGATVSLNGNSGKIMFNNTDSIGVVSDGAIVGIGTSTQNPALLAGYLGAITWGGVTHTPAVSKTGNILVYAQKDTANNKYSNIVNDSLTVGIDGALAPSSTIGVYLKGDGHTYEDINGNNSILGTPSVFNPSTIKVYSTGLGTGESLRVYDGAIGVYSKSDFSGVDNKLFINALSKSTVTNEASVVAYLDGKATIGGDITATGNTSGNAIGVYGTNNGIISVADFNGSGYGLKLTLGTGNDSGTGMYMENGAQVTGKKIIVDNQSSNIAVTNVGVYYDGVTGTHDTDIDLDGSRVVGIFANNGANITYGNKNMTEIGTGTNRYAFIAGESTATPTGGSASITNTGTATFSSQDSIVMYTENGAIINTGTINTTGTSGGIEAGMAAMANLGSTGDNISLTNTGTINNINSLGIVIDSSSTATRGTATNSGIINVTNTLPSGTKAVVGVGFFGDGAGANVTYDGTGSVTNVKTEDAVGLYLHQTVGTQVTDAGLFDIVQDSVAVYSDGSVVDFDVNVQGSDGVALYVENNSTVENNTIDITALGKGTALYVADSTADLNNITINVKDASGLKQLLGMYVADNYIIGSNSGTVTIDTEGVGSTGVYIANGKTISVDTGATINVGDNSLGLYVDGTGAGATTLDTNGGILNLDNNSIGVFNNGANGTSNLGVAGPLSVNFNGTNGILAFNQYGNLNIGNNLAVNGDGTIGFTYNGNMATAHNSIVVNSNQIGFLSKFDNGALSLSYSLLNTGTITVNASGIGMAIENDKINPYTGALKLENGGIINVIGASGVGLYSNTGAIDNSAGLITVDNNGVGVYATDISPTVGVTNIDMGTTNVTKGVGLVVDGNGLSLAKSISGNINLSAGTATDYNIGTYFLNYNGNITSLATTATADYTITAAIEGGNNTLALPVSITGANKNEIGVYAKNSTTILSGNVTVAGDENIGVYGDAATITTSAVTVSTTSAYNIASPYLESSIGMFLTKGSVGNVTNTVANDNSIGIYGGDNTTLNLTNISAGYRAIGVYANDSAVNVSNSINVGVSGYGVFAEDSDVIATGTINVADGTAIGILSQGDGDVTYTGYVNVDAKDATGTDKASIGIYKGNGTGTVTASDNGTVWDIGKAGYGIYLENKNYTGAGVATVNNHADMILDESAVGIYVGGNGKNDVTAVGNNYGNITVGTTYLGATPPTDHSNFHEHLNSVGMYVGNGAKGTNSGTLNVFNDHSVGVYAVGEGTTFVNVLGGTINVDNGGVGVLAREGATITNYGDIILGNTEAACGTKTIGIAAYGKIDDSGNEITTTIDNHGYIEVGSGGVGIYGNKYAELTNQSTGVINITASGGTGMLGYEGKVINKGTINVASGAVGIAHTASDPISHGTITIADDGVVVINNQFIHAGKLEADNVIVNGAYVSIANATGDPMFVVDTISGDINLLPDFINTGNGYGWTVPNFVNNVSSGMSGSVTANTLNVLTSPLFVANITDKGSLVVAKQPYAYLVAGSQFDKLYNGVDSLLALDQDGNGADSHILKNLNSYLDDIYNTQGEEAFFSESERTLAEMRGDIYATIQKRMQTVQGAFDSSFDELLNSYNFTRDTGKYSVIYQQGDFEDKTLGIDDYEYRVQGLLYMKENEGRKFGNKWGYSFGFAVSRFDFDDAPTFGDKSKEDVYSVRAGIHNVHSFGEDDNMRLVSRLELGYNRHEATRTIELDRVYKNEGKYDSYQVTLDNRFEKDLYKSLNTTVKGYAALNIEYGHVDGFKEKAKGNSGIVLEVKSNDYFSVEGEVGVNVTKRVHLGKKISMKLTGDLAYGHEFGTNYDRNKARVSKGTEGYYSLIKPEEEKGHVKGRVGVTFEKANNYGVTFDVEARKHSNKDKADVRYGVKFNYKF